MIRKAYIKKIEETLKSLDEDIDLLRLRSESAGEGLRRKYLEELEVVHTLEKSAKERISELAEAGDAHWGRFKAGVDHSVDELKQELHKATEKIRRAASGIL